MMADKSLVYPRAVQYTDAYRADGQYHPGGVNRQVSGAISWFDDGASNFLVTDVTLDEADGPDDADIFVDITADDRACDGVDCSEEGAEGYDLLVTTSNIRQDHIAHAIGHHLYLYFFAQGYTLPELPAELTTADPGSTWWE